MKKTVLFLSIGVMALLVMVGCVAMTNQPPVVEKVTAPATVLEGSTFKATATASDPDGTVTEVVFTFNEATKTGTFENGVYEATFTAPEVDSDQDYTLTVIAYDDKGGVSAPVEKTITVVNNSAQGEVNDLDAVSEDDPAYVVVVLTATRTQALFEAIEDVLSSESPSRSPRLDSLTPSGEGSDEFSTIVENILSILEDYGDVIEELRTVLDLANQVREKADRYDFKVVFKGDARAEILALFDLSESNVGGKEVALDYRDLMGIRIIAEALVKAYDGREGIREVIEAARDTENASGGYIGDLISDEASSLINDFVTDHPVPDLESQDFWYDLEDLVHALAGLRLDYAILDLKDIFKDDAYVIPGFGPEIDFLTTALDSVLEIDAFERTKTDNKGWTEWYSLYELGAISGGMSESDDIYLVKEKLDQKMLEGTWNVEFKINDLTIVKDVTTLRDVLEKILESLPDGVLTLEISRSFTQDETGIDDGTFTYEFTLDFSKLSSDEIDLKENNIGIDKSFMQVFIEEQIWNWNSWDQSAKKAALKAIVNDFFEKQTLFTKNESSFHFTLNVNDGTMIEDVTVSFANLTSDEVIDLLIDRILSEEPASIPSMMNEAKSLVEDILIPKF